MSDKITFKEFKDSQGESGIRRISLEYARSDDTVTLDALMKKYNMSGKSLRELLDYAITHCVISYQDAILMKEKAHRNQVRHIADPSTETPSDKLYAELLKKRLDTVKAWDDKDVKFIVNLYLTSPLDSAKRIAESQGLSIWELNLVLKKSIVFNVIDDNTVRELIDFTLEKSEPDKRLEKRKILNEYLSMRNQYQFLSGKLAELYNQLKTLDTSSFEEEDRTFETQRVQLKHEIELLEEDFYFFTTYL